MHFLEVKYHFFQFHQLCSYQAELRLVDERHGGKFGPDDDDKTEGRSIMDRWNASLKLGDYFSPFVNIRKLEKHISHVAKLHETLEGRIIARHNEL